MTAHTPQLRGNAVGVPAVNILQFHALDFSADLLPVPRIPPSHHLGQNTLLVLLTALCALSSGGNGFSPHPRS